MLTHTGENPYTGVHNTPIQQQQNKHWVFTPKQAQKEEFNKKKRDTSIQLSFTQCEGKAHYVASPSVKLQIWGFTLSLTVGRNHLNRNQNKISPESPLTHSPWRKALHVSTMKQIIQPISKSEDSLYYYLALTLEKTRTIAHNAILKPQEEKYWDFTCTMTWEKIHISAYNATIGWKQNKHWDITCLLIVG